MAHEIRYYGTNVIKLNTEEQFFMTMMKFKQIGKCNFELSKIFNVSQSTVSTIYCRNMGELHLLVMDKN